MENSKLPLWIFGFFTTTIFLIEAALSIDFSGSILLILLKIDLFAALICWYLVLGIVAPMIREKVWKDGDSYDTADNEQSDGFFSPWIQLGLPILLTLELIAVTYLSNESVEVGSIVIIVLYVLGPLLILRIRSWVSTLISILWIWFPIEWGVIEDALGSLELTLIPLDALIGLFALLWPLIVYGKHIPWYDWKISSEDLKLVGKVSGAITLAIVPLGILTNFITINPDNFLNPDIKVGDNAVVNSVVYIILIFYLIFLVQGIMEETLFRDLIFKHNYYWLQDRWDETSWRGLDLGHLMIISGGLLVFSIPFWDNVLTGLASVLPFFSGIADTVGNMALPLGEYEGESIGMIEGLPLWPFYLIVATLLVILGFLTYRNNEGPLMAALILSSIIFGFAHFQDFRYVFFASIAGFGYGITYYRTKNILPAAMVHMGVDAVWVLLLSY